MSSGFFYFAFLPGVGPAELVVIFLIVLLIFGPKKLPEIGKALGDFVNEFKNASNKPSCCSAEEDNS